MSNAPRTMDQRMLAAQVAIENALADAVVKADLALFGYDEAKLLAGRELLNQTQAGELEYKLEEGEQLDFDLVVTRLPAAVNDSEFSAWVIVGSVRGQQEEKLTVSVEIGSITEGESGG